MATCIYSSIIPLLSLMILHVMLASASSDADILLSFKESVNDPNSYLSDWTNASSSNYCKWRGITCNTASPMLSIVSINLGHFNLSGEISPSICDYPALTLLDLSGNFFDQSIPLQLSRCSALETLNLSNNMIWGTIPDQISQMKCLKVLDLSGNRIEGKIPESIGSLLKLQVLKLGSNFVSGTVPAVLGNLSDLLTLDLSNNRNIRSEIPSSIGTLAKVEQLLLQNCSFFGELPRSFVGLSSVVILDLSMNNLSGVIPPLLGSSLKKLVSFDISQNNLSGPFPGDICKAKGLASISVHKNFINGSLANTMSECLNLELFQVQDNMLSGDFPTSLWSLPRIKLIRAENNHFTGEIPENIRRASQLEQVQIDNNSFSGNIPENLRIAHSLYRFSASLNHLTGNLPSNFCGSPALSIVNLSHNSLFGQIPDITTCKKLVSLSLADNKFSGKITPSLADLPVLTYLDLSSNNLTGAIPEGLQNLKLVLINVSFNHLSGRVPSELVSGVPASFLEGNPGLCGPGVPRTCADGLPWPSDITKIQMALISASFGVAIVLFVAVLFARYRFCITKSQMGETRLVFFYPLLLTEEELVSGIRDKKVSIMSLSNGEMIAVKKLVNIGKQSWKISDAGIRILSKIRHKNIVQILGYCHSDNSVILIYENMQKGSLGDLLSEPGFVMSWHRRLRIAIGIAKGLVHLLNDYSPPLHHRNLKSKNVLLDSHYEPKLTDFALDKVVGEAAFHSIIASSSADTSYRAPERACIKTATEQMDVYSFGVVLLELLTGRQANQEQEDAESCDVVKWVRRRINLSDGPKKVLDPNISTSFHHQMAATLDIAISCTAVMPEKRPAITQVLRTLQSLSQARLQ